MTASLPAQTRWIRALTIIGVIALIVAAVAAVQLRRASGPIFHQTAYPDAPLAEPLELTRHDGTPASLTDYRGSPVLLFFGFTHCPDVCPLTLTRLSAVLRGSPALDDARVILVTVDPERDTPEVLADYVGRFGDHVVGLTGSREQIDDAMRAYGIYAEERGGGEHEHSIVHTPVVFGIDRRGHIRVLLHSDQPDEILSDDIETLAALPA